MTSRRLHPFAEREHTARPRETVDLMRVDVQRGRAKKYLPARTKGPVGPVVTRKIKYGWADLHPALQRDARKRFGQHADKRVRVLSPGSYREV
jgi:hypothetical protein